MTMNENTDRISGVFGKLRGSVSSVVLGMICEEASRG